MAGKQVAVVGAGLAGAAAAAAASLKGARVTLLHDGPGGTAFCSGALDFFGDPCPPHGRPEEVSRDPRKNLESIIMREPRHPYALLAHDGGPSAVVALIESALSGLFADQPPADGERLIPVFSALGTVKFTDRLLVEAAGPESEGMTRPVAVGLAGYGGFDPAMWLCVAGEITARFGLKMDGAAVVSEFGRDMERGTVELAALVAARPDDFVKSVVDAAGAAQAGAMVLPPVVPGAVKDQIFRGLTDSLGVPVYEALSLPPSLAGLELSDRLAKRLDELGVETIRARVTGFTADGDLVRSLSIRDGNGERETAADAVVLASGKFLGGGLVKERGFREKVFGLPVWAGDGFSEEIFSAKLLGLRITDRHPMFEVGLAADREMRPMGRDGKAAFANLFAAGAVLSGYNYMTGGTGAGVALATGVRAGQNAAGI